VVVWGVSIFLEGMGLVVNMELEPTQGGSTFGA